MAVTIRDVAARAGVSVGTVSNALNRPDGVTPAVLARVNEAIDLLGYVPNQAARKLRGGPSGTVGFVVLDGRNPFYNELVRGAEDEAARKNIAIVYGNADNNPARELRYLDLFEEQQVRGVLLIPGGNSVRRLDQLRRDGTPVVLIDRFSGDGRFSSVSVDNVAGGRMGAQHLISTGRTHIAFVGGPLSIRLVAERLTGARSAVDEVADSVRFDIITTSALTADQGVWAGKQILAQRSWSRPDAVFAANDLLALGLLQAFTVGGRSLVPSEIALLGFDDIPFAASAAVPLSTLQQPSDILGQTAMRILLEEAAERTLVARQAVFLPELVVRESTAARS